MSPSDQRRRFEIPGIVRIDEGRGSLPRLWVTSDLASAELYLHGAHLTAFQPRGARPVLFMSEESHFEATKPIRGGIPLIFPWFGPRSGAPESPAHGLARLLPWTLQSCTAEPDGSVSIVLGLADDEVSRRLWPEPFGLRAAFSIGSTLGVEMEVTAGAAPLRFEQALHTYFQVSDVRQIAVGGLENADYIDKVDSFRQKTQPAEPIRITGETDRVYLKTRGPCVVRDPAWDRTITVEKEHSENTVVWNPWINKSRAMPDFGDEEWPRMICVETANVGDAAVRLEAGQVHRMKARISVKG